VVASLHDVMRNARQVSRGLGRRPMAPASPWMAERAFGSSDLGAWADAYGERRKSAPDPVRAGVRAQSDAAFRFSLRALAPFPDTHLLRPLPLCTGPARAGHPLTWNAKEPP